MRVDLRNIHIEVVSTGIPAFDRLIGTGGYPRKYLTMLSGNAGVGKTTLAIQGILEAQRSGLRTLYLETDFKLVAKYFADMGVDMKKLTVIQGEVGEEVLAEMIEELETGKYGFCVLDTVSKLTPREEVQKNFDEHTIGKQAMLIGRFLRKLKPLANKHNIAVLLLNHEREDIMAMGKPSIKTPGGKAIQEDVIVWIRLSHTGTNISESGTIVGKTVKAKVWRKNQVAATEGQEALFEVYFGKGFAANADVLQTALDKGIIVKDRAKYFMDGKQIAYGQKEMRKLMGTEFSDKVKELL